MDRKERFIQGEKLEQLLRSPIKFSKDDSILE